MTLPAMRLLLASMLGSAATPAATSAVASTTAAASTAAATAAPPVALAEIFSAGEKNAGGLAVFGYRIPGFVAASNGSVLVVLAEARKYNCDDAGAHDLVAKRSTDQGKTWGVSQTVVDPAKVWGVHEGGPKGGAVYDPTPVWDAATGKIHVIFSYCPARCKYTMRPDPPQLNSRGHLCLTNGYAPATYLPLRHEPPADIPGVPALAGHVRRPRGDLECSAEPVRHPVLEDPGA